MAPTTTTGTVKQCSRCLDTKTIDQFDLIVPFAKVARKSFCKPCGKTLADLWKAREARTATRRQKRSTRSRP